jgi:hypothetical protein
VPHAPDFLWTLLALMNFMRLSSMKVAHAVVAWCRVQEIRVKPSVGLSGIPRTSISHLERLEYYATPRAWRGSPAWKTTRSAARVSMTNCVPQGTKAIDPLPSDRHLPAEVTVPEPSNTSNALGP